MRKVSSFFILILVWALASIQTGSQLQAQTRWGGIEIGAKGVKSTALLVTPVTGGNKFDILGARTINTSISTTINTTGLISDAGADETAAAVEELRKWLENDHHIAIDKIVLIASSGVGMATNKQLLADKIKRRLGVDLQFVTADEEGKLVSKGAVPYQYHTNSIVLDIGGGNTKGGLFVASDMGAPRFDPMSFSLGSVTLTDAVRAKGGTTFELFMASLQVVKQETLQPTIQQMVDANPGAKYRNRMYLIGGAVWAMSTLMHPENTEAYMKFSYDDVVKYQYRIINDFDGLVNPDLSSINDEEARNTALNSVARVRDTYSRESLLAGAAIIATIFEVSGKNKETYFARNGHVGWLIAYIVDKSRGR